jgi:hypothetical protein
MLPHRRAGGFVPRRRLLAAAVPLVLLSAAPVAEGQVRLAIDPKASLAWWQINPHLSHLWATTCPEEPSWRPGEGRSGGWTVGKMKLPKHGYGAVSDTTIIPLYPRYEALSVCTEAVKGEIVAADTATWRGVHGEVTVRTDALVSGDPRRDEYARRAVFNSDRYPEIRFTVDSVVNVTRDADTLRGMAHGKLTLRNVTEPMLASLHGWPEAGGLRLTARFRIPADSLVPVYGLSSFALGLGVGVKIWIHLYGGVDLVLRPEGGSGARRDPLKRLSLGPTQTQ